MGYVLLVLSMVISVSQNMVTKQYNLKCKKPDPFLYSALLSASAIIFFVLSSGFTLSFRPEIMPYAIGFAAAYAAALVGLNLAISAGPLSITMLAESYSLLIPTAFGILFLHEPVGKGVYCGIGILVISLLFINIKKESVKVSFRWLVYMLIAFIGNGMCSTVQKMQQLRFNGAYKNEFMIVAFLIVAVMLGLISAVKARDEKPAFSQCCRYAVLAGMANGMLNLLIMYLTGLLPNAILFPSHSVGVMLLTFCVGRGVYKEHFSKIQTIGYVLGMAAIILLNL